MYQAAPEISQADLAPLLLQLAAWGGGVSDAQVLELEYYRATAAAPTATLALTPAQSWLHEVSWLSLPLNPSPSPNPNHYNSHPNPPPRCSSSRDRHQPNPSPNPEPP
mgnify:CR=1 FL=1